MRQKRRPHYMNLSDCPYPVRPHDSLSVAVRIIIAAGHPAELIVFLLTVIGIFTVPWLAAAAVLLRKV